MWCDCAGVYSSPPKEKVKPACEQTIQMDVDPLTVNQMKLNPKPDSGALD